MLRLFMVLCGLCPVLVVALAGCGSPFDDDTTSPADRIATDRRTSTRRAVAVQYIVENPRAYDGMDVTLTAQIVDVWSPRVFTIVGQQFAGNDPLLVVSTDSVPALSGGASGGANARGAVVRVSGTVRLETLERIERDYALDIAPAVQRLARVTGPVLVADRTVFSDPTRRVHRAWRK